MKIRITLFAVLICVIAFTITIYTACNSDKCKEVTCLNGGSCNNGICTCATRYEGLRCETKSDPCKNTTCINGGTCVDGKCNCPVGFEGLQCEIPSREKYLGIWTVVEDGTKTNLSQYEILLEKGEILSEVKLVNFYNRFPGDFVRAYAQNDTLSIPLQLVQGYIVEGEGYLDNNTITMYYKITNTAGQTDYFGTDEGEPSIWTK